MVINAVCEKKEQAEALRDLDGIGRIYSEDEIMPYVLRNADAGKCEEMLSKEYLLVRSLDGIGYLKENGYTGEIVADHTLYTFNKLSRDTIAALGVSYDTAPLELTYRELWDRGVNGSELMVYGRIPMMISANCIYRGANDDVCYKRKNKAREKHISTGSPYREVMLTDRKNTDFPVMCDCRYCYNVIFNSVPLSLHGEWDKVRKLAPDSVRLYFTTESSGETLKTAGYYISLSRISEGMTDDGVLPDIPFGAFTKGHFIKGAE